MRGASKSILTSLFLITSFIFLTSLSSAASCQVQTSLNFTLNGSFFDFSLDNYSATNGDLQYWNDSGILKFESLGNGTHAGMDIGEVPLAEVGEVNRGNLVNPYYIVINDSTNMSHTHVIVTNESHLVAFVFTNISSTLIEIAYRYLPSPTLSNFSNDCQTNCSAFTDYDSCSNAQCNWAFNFTGDDSYSCTSSSVSDYCSPFTKDFKNCVAEQTLFGCYWSMNVNETFCKPVDGNCSSRDNLTCENYVGCTLDATNTCVSQNELINSCTNVSVNSTCNSMQSCIWDDQIEGGMCMTDCSQYNGTNDTVCLEAFGGGLCKWDHLENTCDPFGMGSMGSEDCFNCHEACDVDGFNESCHQECDEFVCMGEGMTFSDCFVNDGNKVSCMADQDCVWMPISACNIGEPCYNATNESGFCNPSGMTFGPQSTCFQYDGDQDGCENAVNFGEPCVWDYDPWGPLASNSTNPGWCNPMMGGEQGCWDNSDEESCNASIAMGMPCEWKSDQYGSWCEQKGCWSYDHTNQTVCENDTDVFGLNCLWDSFNDVCFEDLSSGCSAYTGDESGCYSTGYCFWNQSNDTCSAPAFDPMFSPDDFFNPGCWIFDNPKGAQACGNTTSCNWTGTHCVDLGADSNNGIQCADLNDSTLCNTIPMLSSCCAWNGSACSDAPFTNLCWDNMQEPPVGAGFCEDYNVINNESMCDLIAGDPWYMPCEFNATGDGKCHFAANNMFGPGGDFGFQDIGSQMGCEAAGGVWTTNTWEDPNGNVHSESWCEMGFGLEFETCEDSCWACEFQENGSNWANSSQAQQACENSPAFNGNCAFYSDSHAFNGYGWCDINRTTSHNDFNESAFLFEDCTGLIDFDHDGLLPGQDPDCSDFLRNGFVDLERGTQCLDGIDNDGNGFTDCQDPGCMYDDYFCNETYRENDTTAPSITWFEVNTFPDGAFIEIDTDEPTNATVLFYATNNTCSNLNETVLDFKLTNSFPLDDYDVWHDIPLDSNSMVYNFSTNTSYYYKTHLCDKPGNCITSACLNFTTEVNDSSFIVNFNLPPPQDDRTQYLGALSIGFDTDGDGDFNDSLIDSIHGVQFSTSTGRDIDIEFTNPTSANPWAIYFFGADLVQVVNLNISDAFLVNETTPGEVLLGMDSSSWEELAQALGVDYVRVMIPQNLTNVSSGRVVHCPDGASGISDPNCVNINLSQVNCTFTTTSTTCDVPVNIGFSVFGVTDDYVAPSSESSSSGSSSGGSSGSSSVSSSLATYIVPNFKFEKGFSENLKVNDQMRFLVSDFYHGLKIMSISDGKVEINVSSKPQYATLSVGDYRRFDVDEDNFYDLGVTLNSINENDLSANITIISIHVEITDETASEELNKESENKIDKEESKPNEEINEIDKGNFFSNNWIWILILIVIIAILVYFFYYKNKKEIFAK